MGDAYTDAKERINLMQEYIDNCSVKEIKSILSGITTKEFDELDKKYNKHWTNGQLLKKLYDNDDETVECRKQIDVLNNCLKTRSKHFVDLYEPFLSSRVRESSNVYTTVKLFEISKPNANGVIYSKDAIRQLQEKFSEKIDKSTCFGSLENDSSFSKNCVDLSKASHSIERVYSDEQFLMADIKFLDTHSAKLLQSLKDSVIFMPRMLGTIHNNEVVEIADVITIDAMYKPTKLN